MMKNDKKTTLISIFVGIVLLDSEERIYLVKEDDKNKIGQSRWNLPGGSVDGNESLVEAILRETNEETGYSCEINSMLGCYQGNKKNKSWLYIVFEGKSPKKISKITDKDIKIGKWFTKNNFLHLRANEIVHPDMQLVYNTACNDCGLSIENMKIIDYNKQ